MSVRGTISRRVSAALLAIVIPSAGQALPEAFLVKDINTAPVIYSGNPRQLASVGSHAFFVAETPRGSGLWKTDGTAAGTQLMRTMEVIGNLVGVGERLFFVGNDPRSGPELWTSDGTSAGTVLVRDLRAGAEGAFDLGAVFNTLAGVGGRLFFAADDGVHGPSLWRSDGTAAGTVPLKAVRAQALTAAGDTLLFVGYDLAHGAELWRSDGTPAGTELVRDINDGPASSEPVALTPAGDTVFFRADDGLHGFELWKSDPTEIGTVLVSDINPDAASSYPDQLVVVGDEVWFRADAGRSELWRSDGSAAGTTAVAPYDPTFQVGLVAFDGGILFEQRDGATGSELWRSDGTAAGTAQVKDINAGPANSYPYPLTVVNGGVFFYADDGKHGAELWRTDGTAAGTVLVRDINPGGAPSASNESDILRGVNGRLVFAADDGSHGMELWGSDGSATGTELIKDLWPGPATAGASPGSLTPLDGALYFTADDGSGLTQLWRSDGTESGTQPVSGLLDINAGTPEASRVALAVLGGRLVFGADDRTSGNELWSSDGTRDGTVLIKDIWPGPDAALPGELTLVGDVLFFAASDGPHGREVWKSDGTAAGTVRLSDVPEIDAASPSQLTAVGGMLFFTARNGHTTQLWVSDGTTAGTVRLQDFLLPTNLTDVDGRLYFTTGTRLWTSDGTREGTVNLGDFHPASGQYTPRELTAVGSDLFFLAEPSSGVQLLVVGPEHGGRLLGLDKFSPSHLTSAAGRLFFVTADPEHGEELWTSDGTAAGTRMVRDINPGAADSTPSGLSPADDRLLFRVCAAGDCRLWESDGTADGTRPLAELGQLGAASYVTVGSLAFFSAFDLSVGSELWAVPLTGVACLGDCDGDSAVTIAELVRLVRAALGEARMCGPADNDRPPAIDQVVIAVRNALYGCP